MKRFRSAAVMTLAALAALTSFAFAEPATFTLDPAHSRAGFEVKHIFTMVPGYFKKVDGKISLDEKNLANSSVEATIDASSIFTDNEKRDGHLKSEDFFFVEKYPELTFKSKKVVPGKDGAFKIVGDLTMRGVTKEVTLDAKLLGMQDLGKPMGTRAGFEATTSVNRKDYGINWNRALDVGGFLLGDDVQINLTIEAIKTEPTAMN